MRLIHLFTLLCLITSPLLSQNFTSLVNDALYELEERSDAEEAMLLLRSAESTAKYNGNTEQLKMARLLIMKTENYYLPYFDLIENGQLSVVENRLLDAYMEYQLAVSLAKQNKEFVEENATYLDRNILSSAERKFQNVELDLSQAYRRSQQLGQNALSTKHFAEATMHYQKAKSYLRHNQKKELEYIDKNLAHATCGQKWTHGEILFSMEAYEPAIKVLKEIEEDCKDFFPVKNKIKQAYEKIQQLLVGEALVHYKAKQHEKAKENFTKAKKYGETTYFKEQLQMVYRELFNEGEAALAQKEYDEGIRAFTTAKLYMPTKEIGEKIDYCEASKTYNEYFSQGQIYVKDEAITLAKDQFKQAAAALNTEEIKTLIDQCNTYIKHLNKGDKYASKAKIEKAVEAYTIASNAFSTREVQAKLADLR
jgi:tetratricopeptide (TPR) repeat protein